jgi:hypothetical protein
MASLESSSRTLADRTHYPLVERPFVIFPDE